MGAWRRQLAASVLVLGAWSAPAGAQTAEELVGKNLEARGGEEKLAAIQGLRFNGKMRFPGDFELTYQETRARGTPAGDKVRVDASIQGLTVIQAFDGASGWRINPFEGRRDAERMSEDEARSVADTGSISGPLLKARQAGSTVAYLGREDFDGTNAYKLKVTERDGDEFVYLLDPDTMLEIKVTETRKLRGAPQVTEYELGDYERVGGVYYPMSIESWSQGNSNQRQQIIIASAEVNPQVDPAMFAEPRGGPPASGTAAASGPQPAPVSPAKDAAPQPHNAPQVPDAVNPAEPPSNTKAPDPTPSNSSDR